MQTPGTTAKGDRYGSSALLPQPVPTQAPSQGGLHQAHQAGEAAALARLQARLPRLADASFAAVRGYALSLREAHLVVARENGFDTWPKLKHHIESSADGLKVGENTLETPTAQIEAYFQGVRTNAIDQVRALLQVTPALVHERIADVFAQTWVSAQPGIDEGYTALHWTAYPGGNTASFAALAQVLIDHGADVNAAGFNDNFGKVSPVVLAAWEGGLEVLGVLLENGADPNGADGYSQALATAAAHHKQDRIEMLLAHGAEPDFHTGILLGMTDQVKARLDADPSLVNRRNGGHTPLEVAALNGKRPMANLLLERGAEMTLEVAIALGKRDHVKTAIEAEPDRVHQLLGNYPPPFLGGNQWPGRANGLLARARGRSQPARRLGNGPPAACSHVQPAQRIGAGLGCRRRRSQWGRAGLFPLGAGLVPREPSNRPSPFRLRRRSRLPG